MDELEAELLAEIRHIQTRRRIISNDIIEIIGGNVPKNFTIEDALILQEIANGFDEEVPAVKPVLKVVPKTDG
jgi:hypothetical protein